MDSPEKTAALSFDVDTREIPDFATMTLDEFSERYIRPAITRYLEAGLTRDVR